MKKKNTPLNSITSPPLAEDDLGAVAGGTDYQLFSDYQAMAAAEGRIYRLPRLFGSCECRNELDPMLGSGFIRFYREEEYDVVSQCKSYLDVKCYACGRTFDKLSETPHVN